MWWSICISLIFVAEHCICELNCFVLERICADSLGDKIKPWAQLWNLQQSYFHLWYYFKGAMSCYFGKTSHVILKPWPKMYYGWLFLQKSINIFLLHFKECFGKGHVILVRKQLNVHDRIPLIFFNFADCFFVVESWIILTNPKHGRRIKKILLSTSHSLNFKWCREIKSLSFFPT